MRFFSTAAAHSRQLNKIGKDENWLIVNSVLHSSMILTARDWRWREDWQTSTAICHKIKLKKVYNRAYSEVDIRIGLFDRIWNFFEGKVEMSW